MDVRDLLADLRKERAAVCIAIASLERLEHDRHRRLPRKPAVVRKPSAQGADPPVARSASGEG